MDNCTPFVLVGVSFVVLQLMKKMDLKNSRKGFVGGFDERIEKGEMM